MRAQPLARQLHRNGSVLETNVVCQQSHLQLHSSSPSRRSILLGWDFFSANSAKVRESVIAAQNALIWIGVLIN